MDLSVVHIPDGGEDVAWKDVQSRCPTLTDWGVDLLRHGGLGQACKGLEGHVKTVLIEPHYICKDFRNLFSNFYSKKFLGRPAVCSRLHFFKTPGISVGNILNDCEENRQAYIDNQKAYLGYSVIQPVRERCLGRTLIDPLKTGHNQSTFYCLRTSSRVHVNGTEYRVDGYPFHSQSGEATVCAHAALWGVCRYLSERYPNYPETHPYDLIEKTGNASGRRVPYRGMTYADYSEILASFGCHPVIIKPRTDQTKWTDDREAFFDIYAYMESGFPVLVSYRGHVVAVVGHTVGNNLGIHQPETARFYNSFAMVKQFVVVDDNCFPYALLGYPAKSYAENYGQLYASCNQLGHIPNINSIFAAVIPLPEKAFMPPSMARRLCYKYLDHKDVKAAIDDTLTKLGCVGEQLIARLFLTTASSFKKQKKKCARGEFLNEAEDMLSRVPVDLSLPHFIWVMEISPLSHYKQGYCIGEVVLDASVNAEECDYVYARAGDKLLHGNDQFGPGLLHYPQYTHNLGERDG